MAENKQKLKLSINCSKEKLCPCRIWTQCPVYIDITERQKRLSWKQSHNDEYITEIYKWYDTHFRIKFEIPDAFPNG